MYLQIDEDFSKELEKAEYFDINHQEKLVSFGAINTVNLFVGANNSGKSRFLRKMLLNEKFISSNRYVNVSETISHLIEVFDELFSDFQAGITAHTSDKDVSQKEYFEEVFEKIKDTHYYLYNFFIREKKMSVRISSHDIKEILEVLQEETIAITEKINKLTPFYEKLNAIREVFDIGHDTAKDKYKIFLNNESEIIIKGLVKGIAAFDLLFKQDFILSETRNNVYIPILRSAQIIWSDQNTKLPWVSFRQTVEKFYTIDQNIVHTGLDFYNEIKRVRNERRGVRKSFEAFEKFIGETFFNTANFEIVAKESLNENDKFINVFIDGEEHDIHHLGDGIQALLILLYPIYTAQNGTWIFIEEPEINLHPAMQRIFIEQLTNNSFLKEKNLKYFITTHSNHLLDLSMEIENEVSIFTFNKTPAEEGNYRFNIKNVKGGDTEILSLLGVKNSSVFMANCTLWVEGISDRYYIREFLRAYYFAHPKVLKYKEDLNYAFFEYAGSNIEHYMFEEPEEIFASDPIKAQFLSNRILLVADKDKGKDVRHLKRLLSQSKNFQFEILGVREIENLLSEKELSNLLPLIYSNFRQNIDFSKLKFSNYKMEYLGTYLKETFKSKVGNAFIAKSGTIKTKYKLDLAMAAKNKLKWEEMSTPAKQLTEKIYKFIAESNA